MAASAEPHDPRSRSQPRAGRRLLGPMALAAAIWVSPVHGPAMAADPRAGMYVAEFAWTEGIAGNREVGASLHSVKSGQPLYFWTRIVGDESTLAQMEQEGRLPLRHVWYRVVGGMTVKEGTSAPDDERGLAIDDIALSQTSGDVVAALRRELDLRDGWFDWRTWSMKEAPRAGYWYVKVTDNKAQPLGCGEARDGCRILIQVTR